MFLEARGPGSELNKGEIKTIILSSPLYVVTSTRDVPENSVSLCVDL